MPLLDELLIRIGMDTTGVDEGADEVTSKLDKMKGPAALAGAAAGGALALGLSAAMDISEARSSLRDQLGLTEEEAARAGNIAGDVYAAGFGGSLEDVTDSVGSVVSSMGKLGDFTNAELESMSKSALALAKRFEFDVGESSKAAGNLIKNGLAKNGTEAFDLLTSAATKLPKAMREELPALTNEYGDFFDQLGFTGPDMFGLLAEAAKNPIFEIDKVGDAIKELSLRLADTDASREPLKELGLDIGNIQKLVNTGQGTKAFDQIITALKGVDDQTERTRLQAALFGGPGEDMGNTLLKLNAGGAAAASGMDKAAGSSKGLTDAMEDDPAQQMDAAMRTLSQGLGEALLPVLLTVSGFMAEHKGLMQVLVPVVLGLALAFGIFAIAVWAVNAAMLANPITWIILGIVALIAVVVLLIVYWDEIAKAAGLGWDMIQLAVGEGVDWVSGKISGGMDWISDKWSAAWAWISGKTSAAVAVVMGYIGGLSRIPGQVGGWLGELVAWVAGLPGRIGRAASGMWDGIVRSFKSMVNQLISGWNNLSFTIGGGSIMGVSIPSLTLSTPNIPYLADGGITTGPTLAMIGEGPEDEAVLPLSRLEQLITTQQDVRAPSVSKTAGSAGTLRVVYDASGGTSALRTALQEIVQVEGRGDVQTAFGQ